MRKVFRDHFVDHAKKILVFWDGIFCQWEPTPFIVNGEYYSTAEQYMMAQKALLFDDIQAHTRIMETTCGALQKEIGRQVNNFNLITWESNRISIVTRGSYHKFKYHSDLKQQLLDTEDYTLVEASPTDVIWGIGLGPHDPEVFNKNKWEGQNLLGECLMSVRTRINEEIT